MAHTCSDGTQSKLTRTGPVGTMEGVTYSCSHCGYCEFATVIMAKAEALRPAIVAALSRKS